MSWCVVRAIEEAQVLNPFGRPKSEKWRGSKTESGYEEKSIPSPTGLLSSCLLPARICSEMGDKVR